MVSFALTPRCFAYKTCCNHILSAAVFFRGRREHARIQDFLSVFLALSLFYSYRGSPMDLLLRELYLYFTKDSEAVHYFQGWRSNISRVWGPMLISIETLITCYFLGGGSGPAIPLWIRTLSQPRLRGVQWLSGRVLDSRPKGRGFEPHRRHCIVVLEQDTFILA